MLLLLLVLVSLILETTSSDEGQPLNQLKLLSPPNQYLGTFPTPCNYITGWTPVTRNALIPWDLESVPLEIKSNALPGSDKLIKVDVHTEKGHWSNLAIELSDLMTCIIDHICGFEVLLQPPNHNQIQIWKISKTDSAMKIHCDGELVHEQKFSWSSDAKCQDIWGQDVANIMFYGADSASTFYRPGDRNLTSDPGNFREQLTHSYSFTYHVTDI